MLCIECRKNPIFIKKRQLCRSCYMQLYNAGKLIKDEKKKTPSSDENKIGAQKKFEFVQNFFDHKNWYYQSITFKLSKNKFFIPDFYDLKRNIFIKVIPSRQTYHINKLKYKEFKKLYPDITLELRTPDGNLLNTDNPRWEEAGTYPRKNLIEKYV